MKLLGAALAALSFALTACGGSDDAGLLPGPSNVIVFGAQDGDSERYGLYIVEPDGEGLRPLAVEGGVVTSPAWSPETGRIAYLVLNSEQGGLATLRVYDFESERTSTVTERALPQPASWSPDGRRFVFAEDAGGGPRLRIYDVGRANLLDLPELPGSEPAWSPDGDEIVYVSPDGELNIVDTDFDEPRALIEREGVEAGPRWSPDGARVAFTSAPGAATGASLLVLDVDSGAVTELGAGIDAAWPPEGDQLAYSLAMGVPPLITNANIHLVAAGGGEPVALSQASTVDVAPSWSPDGNAIVYLAQADLRTSFVCLVQLDPEQRDCLDLPGLLPTNPVWSPQ
ncbi:MAG: hypothetical protein WD939_05825 [Dehalococcoidia bacterium]